jgi:hypothetical protein
MKIALLSAVALSSAMCVFASSEPTTPSSKATPAKAVAPSTKAAKAKPSKPNQMEVLSKDNIDGPILIQANLMAGRLERLAIAFREHGVQPVLNDLNGNTPTDQTPITSDFASGNVNTAEGDHMVCVVDGKKIVASNDPKEQNKNVSKDAIIKQMIETLKASDDHKEVVSFTEEMSDPATPNKKVKTDMLATVWGVKALHAQTDKKMICYIKAIKQGPKAGA